MSWYKASNQLSNNVKFRMISDKLGIPHAFTMAVVHNLLERCAQRSSEFFMKRYCNVTETHETLNLLHEEIAFNFGIKVEIIASIFDGLNAKKFINLDRIVDWKSFQDKSTERVRAWREKQKQKNIENDVTLRNVTETHETTDYIYIYNTNTDNNINSSKKKKYKKEKIISENSVDIPDWIPIVEWNMWTEMRKEMKKPLSPNAIKLAISKLAKLKQAGEDIQAVLEQSVFSHWQGFHPVKKDFKTGKDNAAKHKGFSERNYSDGTAGFEVV